MKNTCAFLLRHSKKNTSKTSWIYTLKFVQMDHYLERERLEKERRAVLRKQEWMIRFAEMMAAKLKQQKEDEDKVGMGKGKDKDMAGTLGV